MKKNILFIAICAALCALVSCQSTGKKVKEQEFIVDIKSPQIQIGEVEVQIKPALGLGKIKKNTVIVLYAPKEDAVILRFKQDFFTYQQCWSRDGRQSFIEALQKYNEDYDARALELKSRKSLRKYGTIKGYLIWQQFSFSVRARGKMNIDMGYTFKDRAPYFFLSQLPAEYIDENSRDNNRTSVVIHLFLTRAQAAEVAALFAHEFIDGLNLSTPKYYIEESNTDEYFEK